MKILLKKISLFFLSFLILISSYLTILAPSVHAQTWYNQNPFEWYVKVYDPDTSPPNEIFGERYTAAQVQWVVWSLMSMPLTLLGNITGEDAIMCIVKQIGANITDLKDCVTGTVTIINKITDKVLPYMTAAAAPDSRPLYALVFDSSGRELSGIKYTKNLIKKFNPVSEVKAQGYGFQGLTWLQKYWAGFRNMAYALLVLIIIVFAFMIMFRVKLNPQTVITVQSALPKIIIAIILITFSYAIAGFAIDLMYVISGLFVILLKLAGFASANSNNAWYMISGTGAGYSIAGGFWVFFVMLGYAVIFFISAVWSFVTTIVGGASIFGAVVSVIFMLLAVWCLVLMIWYTLKIPYVLLKTLISFYVSVITAPVQILAGTIIPSMGFGAWFKRIMADILVFPVMGLLFWLAWSTLWTSYAQAWRDLARGWWLPDSQLWAPGIIGSAADMAGIIWLAISFGIIVLIPKVPELLKSMIMGEKFAGTGIGEALGPIRQYGPGVGTYGLRELAQGRYPITGKELPSKTDGRVSKAAGWLWGKASGVQQAVRGQ